MTSDTDGTALFDEDCVARFFRPRHALAAPVAPGKSFGVLGEVRLGAVALPVSLSARDERTRALRFGRTPAVNDHARRTGTG